MSILQCFAACNDRHASWIFITAWSSGKLLDPLWTTEPRQGKTNKMRVHPAKTQISLDIRPVWSESLLSAWRKLGSLATHWVHSEDSGQTGWMSRLVWVFAGRTLILLVLSCRGLSVLAIICLLNSAVALNCMLYQLWRVFTCHNFVRKTFYFLRSEACLLGV